jgi:hypothetical protein
MVSWKWFVFYDFRVTIHGVLIGIWIYRTFTVRNYCATDNSHTLQFTTAGTNLLNLLYLHQSLPDDGSQQCLLPCSRSYRLATVSQLWVWPNEDTVPQFSWRNWNHENLSQDTGRDSNRELTEYESVSLPLLQPVSYINNNVTCTRIHVNMFPRRQILGKQSVARSRNNRTNVYSSLLGNNQRANGLVR